MPGSSPGMTTVSAISKEQVVCASFRILAIQPALATPAARRRARAPCLGRRADARRGGLGARRRARLDRRGAHVGRPEARHRARRAAGEPRPRCNRGRARPQRPLSARPHRAGAPPDARDARPEVPPRHPLRGRQPHRRAAEVARGGARPRPRRRRRADAPSRQGPQGRRLAGARQAARPHLHRGRGARQAALRRRQGGPCRHARSARLRLPADRARRGHQDRRLRDGRPQGLPLHGTLGRGAHHRRYRRPGVGDLRRPPERGG